MVILPGLKENILKEKRNKQIVPFTARNTTIRTGINDSFQVRSERSKENFAEDLSYKVFFTFHFSLLTSHFSLLTSYLLTFDLPFQPLSQALPRHHPVICCAVYNGTRHHAANTTINNKIYNMTNTVLDYFRVCIFFHHIAGQRST